MLSDRGAKSFEKNEDGIEFMIVFGAMKFGANALKEWGEEKFFYRTGIALAIWKKEGENKM